ncbi:uncharacterized protein LOC106165139 [Lingula anatina]|uniref:Uncharacterized protein LOC106165139 n=1 Tax=Lingula anatina TaxID=7574 RepID=A0A1S3IKF4_LINAN|nr:uncharacterized protein LOC106165139 [Lingula anatina]|eukprot:XP_013398692.1 uncharacterized protein LOC106165139 [Lingula anatina]
MAVQFKAMLACLFTLLAIHTVSGGEYCCPYYTSYGTYKPLSYCSTYCCGISTSKYCCTSSYSRYYPSYSFSSLCPAVTSTTTTTVRTVGSGEYCCPYYTSSGSYRSSFYCPQYCCGTSTSKYCCSSYLSRYYRSYSYVSSCPTPSNPWSSWSSWSSWTSSTTSVSSGEYCCAYYTSYGSYRSSFYCPQYCCGTSTSKYCCSSYSSRYYRSYSYVSSCPTPSNPWNSWSNWGSWTLSNTSGIINVTGAIVGSVVGFIALCVIIGVVICCATGRCGQRRGTVTRPPGNGIVMLNTQGYPVGYAPPPPNTAYGPGIPQPNAVYGPGTQPPYTGYGPGIPSQQPPNTEFGPGIPPPNNPFGPGSLPNAEAPPLDPAKGAGNDAPPPPYPGTDDTNTPLQR